MSPTILATIFFLLASLVPVICILYSVLWRGEKPPKNEKLNLPPGPKPLPVIGNLHLLGKLPHQSLYHIAKQYGPIMFMKLGFVETVVVSSAQAAEMFLKAHDMVFANRPRMLVSHYVSYGSRGMIFDDYGPYWRNVRKICTLQLLTAQKIESFEALRKEELNLMIDKVKRGAMVGAGEAVNVSVTVGDLSENLICRMITGQRSNQEIELRPLIKEALDLVGAVNIADYVSYIGALDLQGLNRRMKAYRKEMDKVLEKIIDSHEKDEKWKTKEEKDFIDVMLWLMNNQSSNEQESSSYVIDRACIKAIIQDIIIGGFETSTSSIEWTFSELLRHPRVMKSLQQELENVVGLDRMVEESDLPKLTYLDMVIKESLRLYPTLPFIPRKNLEDVTVNGYHIPRNSRILINLYAIGRDCDAWKEKEHEFYPERFKDQSVDLRGRHFQLIPFGSGRRSCPGINLGLRNVKLVVAQLVHCFNWELPRGILPGDLDMTQKYGLTMPRANHFSAVPTYRLLV